MKRWNNLLISINFAKFLFFVNLSLTLVIEKKNEIKIYRKKVYLKVHLYWKKHFNILNSLKYDSIAISFIISCSFIFSSNKEK